MADFRTATDSSPEGTTLSSLPLVMTVEEVADLLRISKQVVYRMILDGEIAASRVGRQYRILNTAVQALLVHHTVNEVGCETSPDKPKAMSARM